MRWHLRLIALCTFAALAAGCSKTDRPSEPTISSALALTAEPCAAVGDRVWIDSNCNGIQDSGEPGASGVTVTLYTCDDVLVGSDVTDGSGAYLFPDVPNGSYYICFTLPDGYEFAPKNQGGVEATDSDANVGGCTDCFTIADCKDNLFVDAGLCAVECTAEVGDRVWIDLNCNGVQDGGESGTPGVTVTLYTCDDVLVDTDVTDGSGNYLFTGVADGSYYVCFTLPDGYTFAPKDQGGVEATDSDANVGGCTDCFTIADCKDNLFVDAGLCRHEEGEGCTPGFWKNHLTHWGPTGYTPDMIFDEVFGCEIFGDDTTLFEAASPEITHNTLAAHGVAALLNASHPGVNFGLTVGEVFDAVCSGDKDTLSDANESLCPLSGGNTKRGGPNSQKH